MAQRTKRPRRPSKRPAPAASNPALPMPALAAGLGVSVRTLRRHQQAGVITPSVLAAGRRPALYDVLDVAGRLLAERSAAATPRDRREEAQARLLELRYKRESGEVLARSEVVRQGRTVVHAVTARLLRLPSALVRAGAVSPDQEELAEQIVREALEELAALERVGTEERVA